MMQSHAWENCDEKMEARPIARDPRRNCRTSNSGHVAACPRQMGRTYCLAEAPHLDYLKETNYCTSISAEKGMEKLICEMGITELSDGGHWNPSERVTGKYVAKNVFVSVGTFVLTFVLVMLGPPIGRRYLAWLKR